MQHCETIEKRGVPTVALVTQSFTDQCSGLKADAGFPTQRLYFTPHPITGLPAEECRQIILGNDPVSGKPLFQEIVDGLTVPGPDDQKTGSIETPRPTELGPDSPEKIEQLFQDKKYTDYLPVVLPTLSRVNDMLKGTSRKRDELVGTMRSTGYWRARAYTVENIASAAVMAGCKSSYLPVVLAIAATETCHTSTSTTSFSSMLTINGPVRTEIGMNCKIGALGPYNHANSTIGRAWTILSKCQTNIGWAGTAYMGSYGNPLNYNNMCFAENEERLPPGWNPFHVQMGFKKEESVVSVWTGWAYNRPDTSMEWELLPQLPYWFAQVPQHCAAVAIFDPDIAWRLYKESGVSSKEDLITYIEDNTSIRAWDYLQRSYHIQNFTLTSPEARAPYLAEPDKPVYFLQGRVNILVVGGETNQFWQIAAQRPSKSLKVDDWR